MVVALTLGSMVKRNSSWTRDDASEADERDVDRKTPARSEQRELRQI
jgi:hypothetical protein